MGSVEFKKGNSEINHPSPAKLGCCWSRRTAPAVSGDTPSRGNKKAPAALEVNEPHRDRKRPTPTDSQDLSQGSKSNKQQTTASKRGVSNGRTGAARRRLSPVKQPTHHGGGEGRCASCRNATSVSCHPCCPAGVDSSVKHTSGLYLFILHMESQQPARGGSLLPRASQGSNLGWQTWTQAFSYVKPSLWPCSCLLGRNSSAHTPAQNPSGLTGSTNWTSVDSLACSFKSRLKIPRTIPHWPQEHMLRKASVWLQQTSGKISLRNIKASAVEIPDHQHS